MADNTQYRFNGQEYGKGRLVLTVIRHHIESRAVNYTALSDSLVAARPGFQIVLDQATYNEKLERSADIARRFFIDDPITDSNGNTIYVSNQWGLSNIDGFVIWAREQGYEIAIIPDRESEIIRYFDAYRTNLHGNWHSNYADRCNALENIDLNQFDFTDETFLDTYWRQGANGICNVQPGMLSDQEFEQLRADLPDISRQIARDPSASTLDSVLQWANRAKVEGRFSTLKYGVIHRVFCAFAPDRYCTIVNFQHLKKFVAQWNEKKLGAKIGTTGNWAELNQRATQAVKMRGLETEDLYLVNTFIYRLKEYLNGERLDAFGDNNTTETTRIDPVSVPQASTTVQPLNQILYGPPGTGKTYSTIEKAVAIADPTWLKEEREKDITPEEIRVNTKERFDSLVKAEQIAFTTFHQSFCYEDFVEGLKADGDNESGQISYGVDDGIFKKICEHAETLQQPGGITAAISDIKKKWSEEPLVLETLTGKAFAVSYRGGKTFRCLPEKSEEQREYPANVEYVRRVALGDLPENLYCPSYVKAIAKYIVDNYSIDSTEQANNTNSAPHVLIIDEINRGNIAKIFGELITLLEPGKRKGDAEAITVTLPYSKDPFAVPANLHVIGTMNTADTSLAKVDLALRRRFEFIEVMPDPDVLSGLTIAGVEIQRLLETLNQRVELLYDRDHSIGHSYFMGLSPYSSINELADVFERQVIPLLEEYFFEDWELIHRVLGDHLKGNGQPKFIIKKYSDGDMLRLLGDDWQSNNSVQTTWTLNRKALTNADAYIGIYAPAHTAPTPDAAVIDDADMSEEDMG